MTHIEQFLETTLDEVAIEDKEKLFQPLPEIESESQIPILTEDKEVEMFEEILRECEDERLFEEILREIHGQAIITNAMTNYKKQHIDFEQIKNEIEHKLNSMAIDLQYYQYTNDQKFLDDYNALYKNKTFQTPLNIEAKMGDNQGKKLLNSSREYLLYAIKQIIQDPLVIIWKSANEEEKSLHHTGVLIFAKSFQIQNHGIKTVNSITINRDNMRILTSSYELKIKDFVKSEIKKPNKIVYVKK